jgi:hypothetical protein
MMQLMESVDHVTSKRLYVAQTSLFPMSPTNPVLYVSLSLQTTHVELSEPPTEPYPSTC